MDTTELFVYYVLPIVILAVGLFGNIAGLIVLSDKKMEKLGPLFTYRLLFVFDTLFLFSGILVYFLSKCFDLNLALISDLTCKIYYYYGYSSSLYSPLLLVYISLDRYISIKYYARRMLLKKYKYQYSFVISFDSS